MGKQTHRIRIHHARFKDKWISTDISDDRRKQEGAVVHIIYKKQSRTAKAMKRVTAKEKKR